MVTKARAEMNEAMFRQEYLASFEKLTGLVYPLFDEKDHVVQEVPTVQDKLYFVGIDVGFTNPTAVILVSETPDHVLTIEKEYYETGKTVQEVATAIKSMTMNKRIEQYIIDPASRTTHQESKGKGEDMSVFQLFQENGIPVVDGNNDVLAGIAMITQLLQVDPLIKRPRIQVSAICKNTIMEFQNYSWPKYKEGEVSNRDERPQKAFDHILDATKYLVLARPDWFERVQRDQGGNVIKELGKTFANGDDDWDRDDYIIDDTRDSNSDIL
jgi:phage terminase large subunit